MNNLSANRGSTNNPVLSVLRTVKHIADFDTWNNTESQETIGDECSQVR